MIGGIVCAALARADDAALDGHLALWKAAAHADYVYAYQKFCECHRESPPLTFVTVMSGRIERVYHLHPDSDREVPARDGSLGLYWTIDELFSLIATAESRGVSYRATYDETLGYPTRIYIDYDPAAVGEEIDIRLTSLQLSD